MYGNTGDVPEYEAVDTFEMSGLSVELHNERAKANGAREYTFALYPQNTTGEDPDPVYVYDGYTVGQGNFQTDRIDAPSAERALLHFCHMADAPGLSWLRSPDRTEPFTGSNAFEMLSEAVEEVGEENVFNALNEYAEQVASGEVENAIKGLGQSLQARHAFHHLGFEPQILRQRLEQ